jgi:transposase-like protein
MAKNREVSMSLHYFKKMKKMCPLCHKHIKHALIVKESECRYECPLCHRQFIHKNPPSVKDKFDSKVRQVGEHFQMTVKDDVASRIPSKSIYSGESKTRKNPRI